MQRDSVVDEAKYVAEKVNDADFDTKMRSSGFVLPPRSAFTIQDMIDIHNRKEYKDSLNSMGVDLAKVEDHTVVGKWRWA